MGTDNWPDGELAGSLLSQPGSSTTLSEPGNKEASQNVGEIQFKHSALLALIALKNSSAVYLNCAYYSVVSTLLSLLGMIIFATYHECNVLAEGRISLKEQVKLISENSHFFPAKRCDYFSDF